MEPLTTCEQHKSAQLHYSDSFALPEKTSMFVEANYLLDISYLDHFTTCQCQRSEFESPDNVVSGQFSFERYIIVISFLSVYFSPQYLYMTWRSLVGGKNLNIGNVFCWGGGFNSPSVLCVIGTTHFPAAGGYQALTASPHF